MSLPALCDRNGYTDYRVFADGQEYTNACLTRLMFTWAILADLDEWGYEDRWCFSSLAGAQLALAAWDGNGEPQGWHRHPGTGRRREGGDPAQEIVNW